MTNVHEPVPWRRLKVDRTEAQSQRVERDKLVEGGFTNQAEREVEELVQGDYSTGDRWPDKL